MIIVKNYHIKEIFTLISIVSLDIGILSIFLTIPSQGYEISIYTNLPFFFIFFTLSFCLSSLIIIRAIKSRIIDYLFKINVFLIFFLNFVLLMLPLIRGYAFYDKHDGMTHFGYIIDILNSGHIGISNYYPILHLLSAILSEIGNISNIFAIRQFFTSFFYLFFILFVYLLVKKISKSQIDSYYAFILAAVPVYIGSYTNFAPTEIFFFMIPFFLYLIFLTLLNYDFKVKFVLILGFLPIAYTHPEIIVFLGLVSVIILLIPIFSKNYCDLNFFNRKKPVIPFLFILISFVSWYYYFFPFSLQIRRIIATLEGQYINSPYSLNVISNTLMRAQLSWFDTMDLIIKNFGAVLIYQIIAYIIIFYLFIYLLIHKEKINEYLLFFSLLVLIYSAITIFTLFFDIVIFYQRTYKYVIFSSVILIALFLTYKGKSFRDTKTIGKYYYGFFYFFLVLAIVISIFNIFPSPITKTYNSQVTAMEFNCARWLVVIGDRNIEIYDPFFSFGRFVNAIEGTDNSLQIDREYIIDIYNEKRTPPEHFNYRLYSYFGYSIKNDKYFIINKLLKVFYSDLWPKVARYTEGDFNRLENDKTCNKIYFNGEVEVQLISSKLFQHD